VPGPVVRYFEPTGAYSGHWGVDLAAPVGSPVTAASPGSVTFAGSVAGMRSVTVDHGGGVKTSYSYLSRIDVTRGDRVAQGDVVGLSGLDHGRQALHFSVRLRDVYQDPLAWLGCLEDPRDGLALLPRQPMPVPVSAPGRQRGP
jgi:murein DD-endopeptidase MepM/ murein hydrolase activator NlpD